MSKNIEYCVMCHKRITKTSNGEMDYGYTRRSTIKLNLCSDCADRELLAEAQISSILNEKR